MLISVKKKKIIKKMGMHNVNSVYMSIFWLQIDVNKIINQSYSNIVNIWIYL